MTNFNMYSCLWFCDTSLHQWHTGLSPYQVLTVNISSLERKLVYTLLETQDRGICGEYGTIWEYDPPGGKWILHAQMMLESKCILTEISIKISITPSLSPTIYKFETYLKDL